MRTLIGSIEVTAAGVRGMEIQSEDTAVRKGQEITLTFALDGYTDIRDGVNALKGTLEFDSDVFEEASGEDFETLNSWSGCFTIRITDSLSSSTGAGSMEGEAVFRLRLTAKQSIPAKEAYITVKELSASEGNEDLFPEDGSLKIDSIAAEGPAGNENGNTKNEAEELGLGAVRSGDSDTSFGVFLVILTAAGILMVAALIFKRKKF